MKTRVRIYLCWKWLSCIWSWNWPFHRKDDLHQNNTRDGNSSQTPTKRRITLVVLPSFIIYRFEISTTFKQYADEVFIPYLHRKLDNSNRLDLVWDIHTSEEKCQLTRGYNFYEMTPTKLNYSHFLRTILKRHNQAKNDHLAADFGMVVSLLEHVFMYFQLTMMYAYICHSRYPSDM